MRILFVGPLPLAGIGQVVLKYQKVLAKSGHETKYITYSQPVPDHDVSFIFMLPMSQVFDCFYKLKNATVMTVCETERVHIQYGELPTDRTIFVPSTFCQERLQRQFPSHAFSVLRHWTDVPAVTNKRIDIDADYIFYTIGNVKDPRKNLRLLLEAFVRLNLPRAHLLVKASCLDELRLTFPWLTIINEGVISEDDLEIIHNSGDCYVNCSHSEGVGMGAVEAAVRDKPVIVPEYGGAVEYVQTPFVVKCDIGPIGFDDFLFSSSMNWGHPRLESLMEHMQHCYDNRLKTYDHSYTRDLLRAVPPVFEYIVCNPVHQSRYNQSRN
jgi:glycosyltransferase involved in cell wall biosynthesis